MFEFKAVMNSIKNLEWKKYFYKNLLICSLVIFMVFSVITIVLTNGYTRAVNNELNRYCLEVSYNIKDRSNRILDIFTESYSELIGSYSDDLTILAYSENLENDNTVKTVKNLNKVIKAYKSDNGYVDSIYMYFPKCRYIISNSIYFSNSYLENFSDAGWIEEYKRKENSLNIRKVKEKNINKSYFTVIKPINIGGYKNLIAYNIDIDGFFNSLNTNLREFYIIDSEANVIYSKDSAMQGKNLQVAGESGEQILNAVKNPGMDMKNIDNAILTAVDAGDGKHKIVIGIDSAEYNTQHKKIRNTLIVIIFIVILLTIALAFFIVSEFYSNILDLVMVFDGNQREEKRKFREIVFVKNKILAMLDKNAKIENELANRIEIVSKTKMEVLQSQLNSHFLYNTLGLISAIDISENRCDTNTVKAISAFSDILRFAMNKDSYVAPLSDELIFMRKYLDIQKIRYKDRFEYTEEIDDGLLDVNIIKMIIQPLIENAVFHGIVPSGRKCRLELKIFRENDMLKICVSDNGVGMTEEKMEELRHKFEKGVESDTQTHGLMSVNQRCMLFYGPEYGCEIECKNSVTTVTVKHPILKNNGKGECGNEIQ